MKIFKYFISKIFLRKAVLGISMILLLCMANYITFTSSRSILSTFQGYQETKYINQEGNYIANLDPDSHMDMGLINENGTQAVYSYLNSYYNYAFYVDGFIVSVPNVDDMEVHLSYMNEKYYKLKQFELLQGVDLSFDYQLDDEIPVLVGKGLSKTYPVGSTIRIEESAIGLPITLKVKGVLKQNAYHSNYYALNSKTYYNFSILFPVNKDFINHANIDLQLNGLMDITILQTSEEGVADLSEVLKDNLGLDFNFFSQKENYDYFNEYYLHSLKIMATITFVLLAVITCISVWNALVSVRLMLKDFTINLLVGLSYSKLRKIFYIYFGMLSFINLAVVFIFTAFNRYGCWIRKDATFVTYGLFGLIGMDWLALLVVVLLDIIIGIMIVETMLRKIKRIPISLGVLQ
ncbi:peptide ABC transporter permease [Petralouisia muris]|uniref:Peptide ABC transporter permease n=1 Tax=Petralouisia muris TaxID=3032872 RepID=A0AC61RW03_9FIRM|nr:ABC transporter permease [Petralouisia muris]TGY95828.1 peptide ABC transporter permease [Petralouisia muris]